LADPFQEVVRSKKRFTWTKELDKNFMELKKRLLVH
jgi:hypothetical protein